MGWGVYCMYWSRQNKRCCSILLPHINLAIRSRNAPTQGPPCKEGQTYRGHEFLFVDASPLFPFCCCSSSFLSWCISEPPQWCCQMCGRWIVVHSKYVANCKLLQISEVYTKFHSDYWSFMTHVCKRKVVTQKRLFIKYEKKNEYLR